MNREEQLFYEMADYASVNFKDSNALDHLRKLKKEADEAIADPLNKEEYADCLLSLFSAFYKAGYDFNDLMDACFAKMEKLKTRNWRKGPDGLYQHIK